MRHVVNGGQRENWVWLLAMVIGRRGENRRCKIICFICGKKRLYSKSVRNKNLGENIGELNSKGRKPVTFFGTY